MLETIAAVLAGYLAGSIPFGLLLSRLAGLGDIRRVGSGNIGATNVLRTGRKDIAAATLILDACKGAVIALIVAALAGKSVGLVAGFAAVLGHNFPVWLGFKGGKGVATSLGVLLVMAWPVGVGACLVWLATAAAFRYSSLAAMAALTASPLIACAFTSWPEALLAVGLAVLALFRHRSNLQRLLAGTEPRIGQKHDRS